MQLKCHKCQLLQYISGSIFSHNGLYSCGFVKIICRGLMDTGYSRVPASSGFKSDNSGATYTGLMSSLAKLVGPLSYLTRMVTTGKLAFPPPPEYVLLCPAQFTPSRRFAGVCEPSKTFNKF